MEHKYIPSTGPIGAKLMIVTDSPSADDVTSGRLFSGSAGKQVEKVLSEAGININNCWQSSVSKYYVPPSPRGGKKIPIYVRAKNIGIDWEQQLSELRTEISSIQPNCILAFGSTGLYATTGKTKINEYRGSILQGCGRKVVATFNPNQLLNPPDVEFKGYFNRQLMVFDSKRALEESASRELQLPSRNLIVCRNSAQLADFQRRYKGYTRPSIDIEALECLPSCIGIAYTPHEGISVPLWNMRGNSNIPMSDLVSCWQLMADMLYDDVVGQNLKYDEDKLKRLGFIFRSVASDTMLKAFAISPELSKSLAFNTSIYTREPYYKDEGADFDISKQSIDDLFTYNARDACVTKEIDLAMDAPLDEMGLREYYENFIMQLHPFYSEIENVGFRVDTVARDRLLRKYINWDERLRYELFQILGTELNTNSPQQVHQLLSDVYKLHLPNGTGEEELTAVLNSAKLKDEARATINLILENRRVRKSISTYLMAMPDYDGRMKTTYYLCLETGRTSTGQQDPPIRPTTDVKDFDGKKKNKVMGIAFQTMTKHGDIGADIREQYIPDEGEIFVQADSSQAEARVIFLLANDEEALELIDTHDYHALTASWFFGGTEFDYSKKVLGYESPIRFAGKTLRHAGHLGASKRRAATEVNTQARKYGIPLSITEQIADVALKVFHAKQPSIQKVFQQGIVDCLGRDRYLIAGLPYGIDAKSGGKRLFFERWGDELFRQAYSYIPQRSVSDNTKAAGLRIKKTYPEIKIIMESHDALLFSIPLVMQREIIPVIKREFERPIDFTNCSLSRRQLVIPCEVETGMNYCHLSKYKEMRLVDELPANV